jgi:4-alpha-glucanotransferase
VVIVFFPICNTKVAGTLVPVFSLRSKSSFGIGDFGDLKKMIDFVSQTGQRVLQILPINDTTITHTWTDSYPYSCISIFAIHPQYVDLNQLPAIADKAEAKKYEALRIKLNALSQIDYEAVNNAKTEYLKIIFEQEGKRIMSSAEYKAFFEESQSWLVPYGHYCMLRDKNGTADFTKWEGNETWNEDDREKLTNPRTALYKEVAFYYFVQFILSSQMKAAHDYARSKHVILKGDIPIGVNRYGCDVWMEPKYFNLNSQAGAPPDDFSVNGQNWGFPTYNWDEMLKDDCIWWVRRFQNMSKFFDAYRIDHVLGFFRIWDIPIDSVHGLLGQFSPSLAMTREEIEAYGLKFQEEHFTRPFITDWILDRIFHERAEEVRRRYLVHAHDDVYNLKPEYDTQRKIEAVFEAEHQAMVANKADQAALQAHNNLRDGLYALVSNVLFIRDRKDANKFHPRISAQLDFTYEALYDCDKAVFNRLYNDYYYHRNNQFWYREAMKKLPKLVQATRMLVCAEDLGMVPDCVPWVMEELKILSLELQSMPKDPTVRFGHLSRNPYRSVCTISSHDMPTLRQWWDENIERTQSYYNTMLYRSGGAPHPLPGWLARDIIYRHLASPSMLCVLSIQDWLAISERLRLADQNAERINIPANPKHYWRYRMHLNIEDLISDQEFTGEISGMLAESGRRQ